MLEQLVAENFRSSSYRFVDAFHKCLPRFGREEIFWRFHFLLAIRSYYTAASPHRIRILSDGKCDPSDPQATIEYLIPFLVAGFRAPGKELAKAATQKANEAKTSSSASRTSPSRRIVSPEGRPRPK